MNTVERFSNRVANYIKYRPGYPGEIVAYLAEHTGLVKDHIIADIGCGPGQSARPFLENGNRVIGVEPNEAMREAVSQCLAEFANFAVVDGSSTATNLESSSVDFVVAAQAFHWFDPGPTRAEFERILRPDGWCVLMWNERQLGTTPFLNEYENLLLKYAKDYAAVRHENIHQGRLADFFQSEYDRARFDNFQDFDFDGLKGRLLSSSYMPAETDATAPAMLDELRSLFAKHNENGRIKILYDTNVYFSRL